MASDDALIEAMADEIAWAIGEPLHSRSPGVMLAAQRALAAIRKTHAVVPREPTPEMLGAWWRQKNTGTQTIPPQDATVVDTSDVAAYRAMLAASQEDGDGS